MFRLEKVFQNDDKFFIYFSFFFKCLTIYITIYLFTILKDNTVYDILDLNIYYNSNYYLFSIFLPILFFFSNIIIFKDNRFNNKNLQKIFEDIKIIVFDILLLLFLNFKKNFLQINIEFLLLVFVIFFVIFFSNIILLIIYNHLIESNIIQRNVLLVGEYKDVLKILSKKKKKINLYKCCIITDIKKYQIKNIRNELKLPIFDLNEDVRSILEYHHLGQVWILDNSFYQEKINHMLNYIIKYSVDILIIKIDKISNLDEQYLINDKYEYINYEISKFYGISFLIKIILDKILSLILLIVSFPILFISAILIYLEDGFPIFFVQDRTGWDGRRFQILKLRSLKNMKFDKTKQVIRNDKRVLKVGSFIRKYSIDEIPQFINVLLGDMSIVGPRPHMVEHDIYYSSLFKKFLKRHKTSPGITGWAQVNGLRGATINSDTMKKRMEYDLWYLNNWTILLDILIIFKTFYALFKYKGD